MSFLSTWLWLLFTSISVVTVIAAAVHFVWKRSLKSQRVDSRERADRTQIFVSYCHRDRKWLARIRTHLAPFVRNGYFDLWDDSRVRAGSDWFSEIDAALDQAAAALLLVSPSFLASKFVMEVELPRILAAAKDRKVLVLWIPVSQAAYEETALAEIQSLGVPSQPLDSLSTARRQKMLVTIARQIKELLAEQKPEC